MYIGFRALGFLKIRGLSSWWPILKFPYFITIGACAKTKSLHTLYTSKNGQQNWGSPAHPTPRVPMVRMLRELTFCESCRTQSEPVNTPG